MNFLVLSSRKVVQHSQLQRTMQLRPGLVASGGLSRRLLARPHAFGAKKALLSTTQSPGDGSKFKMPFKSIMAANRGEIAVRIMRAGNELGLRTVGIFSKEDRFTQHRYGRRCGVCACVCVSLLQSKIEPANVRYSFEFGEG